MTATLRPLSLADAEAVQALLDSSPAYIRRTSGHEAQPDDGRALLTALPPGVDPAAKTVHGLHDETGALLGIMDVLTGWPEPGAAHIGLLLIREDRAGEGLGRALHDAVTALLAIDRSLVRLRAGIVATNADVAEPFWRRLGYRPTGEQRPFADGEVRSTTAIWTRPLRPTAGLHHLELWTADLSASEPAWDWLLRRLCWAPERVDGWDLGRIWRHRDGSYLVLEQSDDVRGDRTDRRSPGMNHVALGISDRAALDALRANAGAHGWRELFAERYPHAGGEDHLAWYAEDQEGIEVEVVATIR